MIQRTPIHPGIYFDMPQEQYHNTDAVSNSMLADLANTPAHCYALHLDPARPQREQRPWMLTGPLAHCAVLEPGAIASRYIVVPENAPRRPTQAQWKAKNPSPESVAAMAWWADFNAQCEGREVVTFEQRAAACGQLEAVARVPELAELLSSGVAEASAFWRDEATGLMCRARPDWLHHTGPKRVRVLDLKTISNLSMDSVQRSIGERAYHRQAAHYSNGLIANGLEVEEFVFGFVSSAYPFLAAAVVLDTDSMAQAHDEVSELLELYARCQRTGTWPAFNGYQLSGLPAYKRRSAEVEVSYAA